MGAGRIGPTREPPNVIMTSVLRIVCVIAGVGAGVALSLDASVPQPAQRVTSLADTRWRLVTFDETRPTEYT